MIPLERTADALAVRPCLWINLPPEIAAVLRARINGQAYTAIAQTLGVSHIWTPLDVKKYESAGCALVLKKEEIEIKLDQAGYGKRWGLLINGSK